MLWNTVSGGYETMDLWPYSFYRTSDTSKAKEPFISDDKTKYKKLWYPWNGGVIWVLKR